MEQLTYRTPKQSEVLFALLNKLRWIKRRADLVEQFTDGRTASTAKLTVVECRELNKYLRKELRKTDEQNATLIKMRRKFFAFCHELGWKKDGKLDYDHIGNWLSKYGGGKKHINAYDEAELRKLLVQIEKVLETKQRKQA